MLCWMVLAAILALPCQCVPLSGYAEEDSSVDELIVNAANSSKEFEFFYDEKEKLIKVEYDIVLSQDEYVIEMVDEGDETDRKKRTAAVIIGTNGAKRWTDARVPYQFNGVDFTTAEKNIIRSALQEWSTQTCLKFVEANEKNRLFFKNAGGCFSRVGMVGGAQVVGLAKNCRHKGVALHEVGHAIGLHHEQTRPDRDNHVTIKEHNIPEPMRFNFRKFTWKILKNLNIPYDFNSIMHYGKNAFSMNGRPTIVTVDPKMQDTIGQKRGLSFRDVKTVNIMYNCKRAKSDCTKDDSSCPGEGFVGKDCQCWCPGSPTQLCSKGGAKTDGGGKPIAKKKTKIREKGCEDQHQSCTYWASTGECTNNPAYMLVYCKNSCKSCSKAKENQNKGTKSKTQGSACTDMHTSCSSWASYGYCNYGFVPFMSTNCKKSCGKCPQTVSKAAQPVVTQCKDKNHFCRSWSQSGECQRNPAYMNLDCPLSCNKCGASKAYSHQPVQHSAASMSWNPYPCVDSNTLCYYWSSIGQCYSNPAYMNSSCRKSCRLC